ncbi:hypothetical protein BY996DRAFT_6589413 [Phakopsora pachyrhizi]|nr:hypothetical protein BY996DRAFT_6589413 [Phakopsora pachyrhizi]
MFGRARAGQGLGLAGLGPGAGRACRGWAGDEIRTKLRLALKPERQAEGFLVKASGVENLQSRRDVDRVAVVEKASFKGWSIRECSEMVMIRLKVNCMMRTVRLVKSLYNEFVESEAMNTTFGFEPVTVWLWSRIVRLLTMIGEMVGRSGLQGKFWLGRAGSAGLQGGSFW